MKIRIATKDDAADLLGIYEHYVKNTAVSFEYDVPGVSEFENRIENTLKEYPYLVAENEKGEIVGYAYASAFHSRVAYKHWAEVSIYLEKSQKRKGIGSRLYKELEELLVRQNVYTLCACIAVTERAEDEHLNDDSVRFHGRMGYRTVAGHELCGYKFGKWYSIVWMEKSIAPRPDIPEEFVRFGDLK